MPRVLFIAALHHPQQLQQDIARAPAGQPPPLFPHSMGQRAWEKAFRAAGYRVDVFWRNLPAFGPRDTRRLRREVFRDRWTPQKAAAALMRRVPPRWQPAHLRRNQLLLAQARRFQPDIIWLSGDNREILPRTLAQLKAELGCTLIYVSGVSPIVFSHKIERAAARLYDLVLVNDFYHGMQWRELGAPRVECLPYVGVDPELHQPPLLGDAPRAYVCDIGFVGTLTPPHLYSERVAALARLRGFDLGIWSMHEVPPPLRPHYRGAALGEAMLQALSSVKISVNIHGDFMRYGGNMRLFESAALGAFQLVDDLPGVHKWFRDGEHLVTFQDADDLVAKARYYLEHAEERRQIAAAGRAHALAHHRYDQRLARVEALLADL